MLILRPHTVIRTLPEFPPSFLVRSFQPSPTPRLRCLLPKTLCQSTNFAPYKMTSIRHLFLFVLLASLRCGNGAKTLPNPHPHRAPPPTVASALRSLHWASPRSCLTRFAVCHLIRAGAAAAGYGGGAEGFCSAEPSNECSGGQPLYWKVTHPTLAPTHLQGA
jgi:hypothetical protein